MIVIDDNKDVHLCQNMSPSTPTDLIVLGKMLSAEHVT